MSRAAHDEHHEDHDETRHFPQAAAIPFRTDPQSGRVQVMLIRRRDGRKWGIPKGMVDPGLTPAEAAAMEAREEAGLEGRLSDEPLGSFTYGKFGGTCLVRVFVMRVTRVMPSWDEEPLRERRWFDINEAATIAGRPEVRRLISSLAAAASEAACAPSSAPVTRPVSPPTSRGQ
jgi:phosphohistidine phosphatase